jgi:hypothetical protein
MSPLPRVPTIYGEMAQSKISQRFEWRGAVLPGKTFTSSSVSAWREGFRKS